MNLRPMAVALGVIGLSGTFMVALSTPAQAHGGLTFPATRTYACYVDGLAGGNGGDLNPTNPACAEAVRLGGKQPLWDWFGNLISNAAGRHREIIPDGKLCGPTAKYDAYNIVHSAWPVTQLQSGATIRMRYNAWAPHPGTWYQYVTRDGWDPNQPLRWSDLEPTPFDQITNPPIDGSGPHGAEYTWQARLPNKSGRHIIYSIWQRNDSPEAFYNCADVVFGGQPPTSTTTTTTTTTTPPPTNCSVSYTTPSTWSNGFVADVRISNNGTTAINGWRLNWSFTGDQRITNHWSSAITQNGGDVTAVNAGWNSTISPGGSVTFGFQASFSNANPRPGVFTLNGSVCGTATSGVLTQATAFVRTSVHAHHSAGHFGH
jgi:predicted carbohydrate-binding protein with CBM5 and CBM33 domain